MKAMEMLTAIACLLGYATANLICHGDFQAYGMTTTGTPSSFSPFTPYLRPIETYYYLYIPQDMSCWYIKWSTLPLELKKVSNPPTSLTTTCDLISMISHPHCQTIQLEIGKFYNLSFNLYLNENPHGNITMVSVNGQYILSVQTKGIYEPLWNWTAFQALNTTNQICFQHMSNISFKGPNLDNVVLIEIPPTEYNQSVWVSKKLDHSIDSSYPIIFQTDYYVPIQLREQLGKLINVYIKSMPDTPVRFQLVYSNNSALKVYAYEVFQYYNEIALQFPVKIIRNSTIIYYRSYQENANSNLTFMAIVLKWTKVIGKTFLCSYLIFSLLGLWNLLLLYNFLLIKTIPNYVYATLVTFCNAFYSGSSFVEQIDSLKGYLSSFEHMEADQDMKKLPDLMNGEVWFGSMGFSSGFFANNLQTFILLLFLIVKLWLFSILNEFMVKRANVRRITFKHRLHIFLIEIISSCPQTLISAGSNLLKAFTDCMLSKTSTSLSISIILLLAFIIFYDYLLTQFNETDEKNSNNNEMLMMKNYNHYLSQEFLYFFLLHFTIPIFVVTRLDYCFFFFVTVLLLARFGKFYMKKQLVKGFLYFKLFFINLGWIFYHFVFMFLWIAEKLQLSSTFNDNQNYNTVLNIGGAYIIFFIFASAVVQIIDFIITIPSHFFKPIFKTCKLLNSVEKCRITHVEEEPSQVKEAEMMKLDVKMSKGNRKEREMFTLFQKKKKVMKEKALNSEMLRTEDKGKHITEFEASLQKFAAEKEKEKGKQEQEQKTELQKRKLLYVKQNRERIGSRFKERHIQSQ